MTGIGVRKTMSLVAGAICLLAFGGAVRAHHSQAPFFDQSRDVEIEGTVQRFDFRNPHAILYVDVAEADGSDVTWELQFASVTILLRAGVSAATFVPGERIRARGHPARNVEAAALAGVEVTKADGSVVVDPLRSGEFASSGR